MPQSQRSPAIELFPIAEGATRAHRARIRWLTKEEGGRHISPVGPHYSTVARFESMRDRWPNETLNVILHIERGDNTEVGIRSLIGAPEELTVAGNRFELFEGRWKVAEGVVL